MAQGAACSDVRFVFASKHKLPGPTDGEADDVCLVKHFNMTTASAFPPVSIEIEGRGSGNLPLTVVVRDANDSFRVHWLVVDAAWKAESKRSGGTARGWTEVVRWAPLQLEGTYDVTVLEQQGGRFPQRTQQQLRDHNPDELLPTEEMDLLFAQDRLPLDMEDFAHRYLLSEVAHTTWEIRRPRRRSPSPPSERKEREEKHGPSKKRKRSPLGMPIPTPNREAYREFQRQQQARSISPAGTGRPSWVRPENEQLWEKALRKAQSKESEEEARLGKKSQKKPKRGK
jgi:hypothetical protein